MEPVSRVRRRGVPRPQRQRADGPVRGPPADPRGGSRTSSAPVPRGEGRADVPDRHRGRARTARCIEDPGRISKSPTSVVVLDKHLSHFNVHVLGTPGWRPGGTTPSRRSPSRRRTASRSRSRPTRGTRSSRTPGSPQRQGVLPVARAARGSPPSGRRPGARVRRRRRQEYVAVGIRAALHPTLDLATEPRWARQAETFGRTPTSSRARRGLPQGFQQDARPGQRRVHQQALPRRRAAEGRRGRALPLRPRTGLPRRAVRRPPRPFPAVIQPGTAAIMPYYGMPVGLEVDGERSRRWVRLQPAGRHRPAARQLGYDGVVVTDWELGQRQPRRRRGAARAGVGRRAPRPPRPHGAHPRGRRRPVRRGGVRRDAPRPRRAGPGH